MKLKSISLFKNSFSIAETGHQKSKEAFFSLFVSGVNHPSARTPTKTGKMEKSAFIWAIKCHEARHLAVLVCLNVCIDLSGSIPMDLPSPLALVQDKVRFDYTCLMQRVRCVFHSTRLKKQNKKRTRKKVDGAHDSVTIMSSAACSRIWAIYDNSGNSCCR